MEPKVSVLIPVYNVAPYLRECMESVTRQTLGELEIICVNDGSTDESPVILREYAERDGRILLIDQENGGYGRAMNAGLARARGEYIGIVEPDDFVRLTMFEDLYAAARERDLDLVKADFERFTTDEAMETRTFQRLHLSPRKEDYGRVFRPREEPDSFLFVMNTWTGIYQRDFLERHGIRHQETPGASFQDNGFWFQTFLRAERAMLVDTPYYCVRRDNPNSSVRSPEKVYAINREYDYIRGILTRDPADWEALKGVYWHLRVLNCGATLRRIDPKYRREYLETVGKEIREGLAAGEFSLEGWPPEEQRMARGMMAGEWLPPPEPVDEITLLKNSFSYRLGRGLTWLPRRVLRRN